MILKWDFLPKANINGQDQLKEIRTFLQILLQISISFLSEINPLVTEDTVVKENTNPARKKENRVHRNLRALTTADFIKINKVSNLPEAKILDIQTLTDAKV